SQPDPMTEEANYPPRSKWYGILSSRETRLHYEKRGKKQRMITQIELDGFKTFKDFKVELAPFQVIVGPNGAGKSNLFDALHLLSRLADVDDLRLAFQAPDNDSQKLRGDAHQLFTALSDGLRTDRIRMAVERWIEA